MCIRDTVKTIQAMAALLEGYEHEGYYRRSRQRNNRYNESVNQANNNNSHGSYRPNFNNRNDNRGQFFRPSPNHNNNNNVSNNNNRASGNNNFNNRAMVLSIRRTGRITQVITIIITRTIITVNKIDHIAESTMCLSLIHI